MIPQAQDLLGLLHQKKNQYMMDHGYNHQDHLTHYQQSHLYHQYLFHNKEIMTIGMINLIAQQNKHLLSQMLHQAVLWKDMLMVLQFQLWLLLEELHLIKMTLWVNMMFGQMRDLITWMKDNGYMKSQKRTESIIFGDLHNQEQRNQ